MRIIFVIQHTVAAELLNNKAVTQQPDQYNKRGVAGVFTGYATIEGKPVSLECVARNLDRLNLVDNDSVLAEMELPDAHSVKLSDAGVSYNSKDFYYLTKRYGESTTLEVSLGTLYPEYLVAIHVCQSLVSGVVQISTIVHREELYPLWVHAAYVSANGYVFATEKTATGVYNYDPHDSGVQEEFDTLLPDRCYGGLSAYNAVDYYLSETGVRDLLDRLGVKRRWEARRVLSKMNYPTMQALYKES